MTRLRGASVGSPDVSRSSGGIDRPQFQRSKLPPNAPEVIVQNTVEVSDPSQVLPWCRDERRRQFNLLVRRYKNQVLYGCQDPGCHTPTCASYRRRVTEGPFRRYTELSARTLACYLASLDNAEDGLCRNAPRVPSEFLAQDNSRRSKRRSRVLPGQDTIAEHGESSRLDHNGGRDSTSTGQTHIGKDTVSSNLTDDPTAARSPRSDTHTQHDDAQDDDNNAATHQMKDPKSFTQNLFDTLSLRMVEWLPLRRSPEKFQPGPDLSSIRTPGQSPKPGGRYSQGHTGAEKRPNMGRTTSHSGSTGSGPNTPSTRFSGGQPTAVEVKFPNQQVKRLSLTEVDQWRPSSRSSLEEKGRPERKPARKLSVNTHTSTNEFVSMPSPPALKHRPQKHRGRIGDTNSISLQEEHKKPRRVSWDGTKVLNDALCFENQEEPIVASHDRIPSEAQSPSESKPRRKSQRHKRNTTSTVQTVTHLTSEIVEGLGQMMVQSEEEAQTWRDELASMESAGNFEDSEWHFATPRQRQVFAFVAQTVFYTLGSAKQVLHSFRKETQDPVETKQKATNTSLDFQQLQSSLRRLFTICPWDIALHSLWSSLEKLFVPPKELSTSGRQSRRSSTNSTMGVSVSAPIVTRRASDSGNEHVTDSNAADIATVTLLALISAIPQIDAQTWRGIIQMRGIGAVTSNAEIQKLPTSSARLIVEVTDKLEHELALRLMNRLVRALTARVVFHEISKTRQPYTHESIKQNKTSVLDLLVNNLSKYHGSSAAEVDASTPQSPGAPALIAEWIRTLLLREWDGNPEISRSSAVGGAVQILSSLYKERNRLGLVPEDFHTPFLAERLDPLEMPVEWLESLSNNKTMHLLSYSFLFPPSSLVIYFRALNYSVMSRYYESAMTTTRHVTQTAFGTIPVHDDVSLLARMKTSMSTYLVLVVRRDNVVTDSLNQLWRREKRELMRPLKVQMGMDEGEEGLDHGGVQQEFFRVLMAEALDPAYGMFTMDARTRNSWFQPGSWEPLYKFELLGLLMSLAVYNGLTLPVTFPIAFYRKLLGLKVKQLDQIQDGWPELTRGLGDLLTWQDGDVGDIFMRTYEFSFEAFGSVETVDMQRVDRDAVWPLPSRAMQSGGRPALSTAWSEVPHYKDHLDMSPPSSLAATAADLASRASSSHGDLAKSVDFSIPLQSPTPPSDEACLVTNANRHQFVKDYIFWLTDKSIRAQFEAFARGFYTCLDRSALSIFTPEALKTVVEGIQEIDMKELERHARYEGGFGPNHPVICDFWNIVQGYSAEKKAQLLEFVTASDRIPVNGISSIMFVIQKNGVGDAVSSLSISVDIIADRSSAFRPV
ncbi:hypothetical protein AWENTII_011442 [Aspergillus wentii]